MKKYFVFAVFMLFAVTCFSQDYIYLKSGEALAVIVLEEGAITVRYRYFDDTSKKMYFIEKSDIYKIVYQNGKEVIYNKAERQNDDNRTRTQERDNYNQSPSRDDYYNNRIRPDNYENRRQAPSNNSIENYARKREPFSEFHVGVVLPQGDFADDNLENCFLNSEGFSGCAATGFNLGYKYYSPLSVSYLSLVFGLDGFYNGLSDDFKDAVDETGAISSWPAFLNFAATAGLNLACPVSDGLSIYGEVVGGFNWSKMTDMKGTSEDSYYNRVSAKVTFDSGFGFCYAFGGGILINKQFSIGLRYNDLNSYKYKMKAKEDGKNAGTEKTSKLSITNLTITLGILF
jgi:hypothetical protein